MTVSDTGLTATLDCTEVEMLVLSRKPSQRILIGKDVAITIVRIDRNQVRIGVEAPAGVTILRDELTATGPVEIDASGVNLTEALWSVG